MSTDEIALVASGTSGHLGTIVEAPFEHGHYCPLCEMWMGPEQVEDHLKGKKHRKIALVARSTSKQLAGRPAQAK